jgi:hypothetical protein
MEPYSTGFGAGGKAILLIAASVAAQVIGANNPELAPLVWVGAAGFIWSGWIMRGGD